MKEFDYIILGGGAAGLQLAYRMANDVFFDSKSILIIDKEQKNSNDRTWCFWEKGEGEWDAILHTKWDSIVFESDTIKLNKNITPYHYKLIRSKDFYDKIWRFLHTKNNFTFQQSEVESIHQEEGFAKVTLPKIEYTTQNLLNSIMFDKTYLQQKEYPVLKQHFVGWFVELKEDYFDETTATFMDFNIPQQQNTRFMYVLPLSKKVALFEYTLFSEDLLSYKTYEEAIKVYLKEKNITDYKIIEKEDGVIPMTAYKFWNQNSKNILYMGTAGGWSKASTGFTFKNTAKKTAQLVGFLKSEQPLYTFHKKTKFWYYDLLLLDVLSKHNQLGSSIFTILFRKNATSKILKFLDEETTFLEDLKIMLSMPPLLFVKALLKRVF